MREELCLSALRPFGELAFSNPNSPPRLGELNKIGKGILEGIGKGWKRNFEGITTKLKNRRKNMERNIERIRKN